MREKLKAKIAEMDAARGRPLTAVEQLHNLKEAMMHCDSCDKRIELWWTYCAHCGDHILGTELPSGER